MKKSDMQIGLEVAVVPGEGQYDRRISAVTKAVVREVGVTRQTYRRRNDGVRVEYVGEPPVFGSGQDMRDGTYVISSKQVWMTWEEAAPLVAEYEKEQQAQHETNRGRNERIAKIAERFGERGIKVDLEWLSNFQRAPSDQHGQPDEKLLIPADALEGLLDQ